MIKSQATYHVQTAVISISTNDINKGKHAETRLREISELRALLIYTFSVEKLIFPGIPPVHHLRQVPKPLLYLLSLKANIFGQFLQDFCNYDQDCFFVYIDLPVNAQTTAIDGFHPNQVFYLGLGCKNK